MSCNMRLYITATLYLHHWREYFIMIYELYLVNILLLYHKRTINKCQKNYVF